MFSISSEQKGFTCVIHISYNLEGEKNGLPISYTLQILYFDTFLFFLRTTYFMNLQTITNPLKNLTMTVAQDLIPRNCCGEALWCLLKLLTIHRNQLPIPVIAIFAQIRDRKKIWPVMKVTIRVRAFRVYRSIDRRFPEEVRS